MKLKLNRPDIIKEAAARSGLQQKQIDAALDAILATIKGMPDGATAFLAGFGKFERKVFPGREGRNPKTGETVMLPRKVKTVFRASAKAN